MSKRKYITPTEYAAMHGKKIQQVTKRIRDKGELQGIAKIEKVGRFYLLYPRPQKDNNVTG